MLRLLISGLGLLICTVNAASNGEIDVCGIESTEWGCTEFKRGVPEDNRNKKGDCVKDEGQMFWAWKPIPGDDIYKIRSGNSQDSSDDVKAYTPGKLLQIYFKVLKPKMQFRGLLVNVHNKDGKGVGSWEFPEDQTLHYWTPQNFSDPTCGESILFHRDAQRKPYTSHANFRAPPKGTGTITFKVLIKQGPANTGQFYQPKVLTLTEGAAARDEDVHWVQGENWQSCTAACAKITKSCDESSMQALDTKRELKVATADEMACGPVVFNGCSSDGIAPALTPGGTCFYSGNECDDLKKTGRLIKGSNSACGSRANQVQRICACKGTVAEDDAKKAEEEEKKRDKEISDYEDSKKGGTAVSLDPTLEEEEEQEPEETSGGGGESKTTSSQTRTNPSVVGLLCASLLLISGATRRSGLIVLVVVLSLSMHVNAHNWFHSEARSRKQASSMRPCPPRTTPWHVQVSGQQKFSIAWATGHSGLVYVATVHADDAHHLKNKKEFHKIAEDYLMNAPADVPDVAKSVDWRRKHGSKRSSEKGEVPGVRTITTIGKPAPDGKPFRDMVSRAPLSCSAEEIEAIKECKKEISCLGAKVSAKVFGNACKFCINENRAESETKCVTKEGASCNAAEIARLTKCDGNRPCIGAVMSSISSASCKLCIKEKEDNAAFQCAPPCADDEVAQILACNDQDCMNKLRDGYMDDAGEEVASTLKATCRECVGIYGMNAKANCKPGASRSFAGVLSKVVSDVNMATGFNLWNYKEERLADDVRKTYKSNKYPWLLSLAKVHISESNFGEFDILTMQIPPGSKPGHYIVHWDWSGYNDCVDVELRSKDVVNINGDGTGKYIYQQYDHCQYTERKRLISTCNLVDPTVQSCLDNNRDYGGSGKDFRVGVNSMPMINPSNVPDFFKDVAGHATTNVPWDDALCRVGDALKLKQKEQTINFGDWETKWKSRSTKKDNVNCGQIKNFKGYKEGTEHVFSIPKVNDMPNMRAAAEMCSTMAKCTGIATKPDLNSKWFLCQSFTDGGDFNGWEKQAAYQGTGGKSNLDTFNDENENNWDVLHQISFQKPGLNKPEGWLIDEGEMYGTKGGAKYGWVHCKHEDDPEAATSRDNKIKRNKAWATQRNVDDTSHTPFTSWAKNTHKTCQDPTQGAPTCPDQYQDWGYTTTDPVNPPPGCIRNKWELDIANGWYKIELYSEKKDHGNEGCAVEGRRMWTYPYPMCTKGNEGNLEKCYDVEKTPGRTYVQVTDGKLTFEDMGYSFRTSSQAYSCWSLMGMRVFKMKDANKSPFPKAWIPGTTGPWMQVELEKSTNIGAISLQQIPEDNAHTGMTSMFGPSCAGGWLFNGDHCVDLPNNRARSRAKAILAMTSGYHDQDGHGAIVRVSDKPCKGTSCPGEICGRIIKPVMDNGHVSGTRQVNNEARVYLKQMVLRHMVDCKGKKGKYVSIQLDGDNRILTHGLQFEVSHNSALDDPEKYKDKHVCYGVAAPPVSAATPEMRFSSDPEDPVFYSSCFSREKELYFLPPEDGKINPPPQPYIFEDQCLDCESYKNGQQQTPNVPAVWKFSDPSQCFRCD